MEIGITLGWWWQKETPRYGVDENGQLEGQRVPHLAYRKRRKGAGCGESMQNL